MALAIRLARGGRKNRPHYSIVVTDKRNPRDGRFIEKLGTYNPLLKKDDANRVNFNEERVKYWLGQGAQASDRVAIFFGKAGVIPMPERKNNPQKAEPSAKTKMRVAEKAEKVKAAAEAAEQAKLEAEEAKKAAAEAAAAAAAAPAEEAPAEEAAAEEPKAE
ncbi:MAG: 30S ribosomal protein S16 [Micavibrio aeruginosavorus]|uniref:Small ribosomal subunit protein bS16 n=1 Tax=Micavibrio aeruginosavorus TaxID=349221 RepID=A0A2W5MWL2_9BACT|nr:MAG: 30S ribosomal protein S16 [Micavibrio aeruginosavorus]